MRRAILSSILVFLLCGIVSASELSEAMDTSLSFTTFGSADWFGQSAFSYYDGDAAQSGSISHNQESWMQTTLSGAGTLSFYWKVSSENSYDFLEFYIDGVIQDQISGSQDWQQMIYTLDSGSHTLEWWYFKDGSVSDDSDCGWVDQVEWVAGSEPPPPPPPAPSSDLSEAMDTTLSFSTGGSADWFGQSTTFYYDGDAAQSGVILNNQESWMQTTVSGPTTVSFYWKVSSENSYDFLELYIDGSLQDSISGSVDWQQMTYALGAGSHTLKWRYVKDSSASSGSDCGWVDHVELGADTDPPPSSRDLSEALDTTLSFTTGGGADWFGQSAFSYYDGDAAQSGSIWHSTITHNQESWMQTTLSGAGTVSFYWKVSSEQNYDFLEFYIDGVIQDQISGLVNWQQKVYTINTSGFHTLEWVYIKDRSVSDGSDCGWVDQVEWDGDPQPTLPLDAWLNINSSHYDFSCGEDSAQHSLAYALEGISSWEHYVNHTHWFILDLGEIYNIKKVKGCSNGHNAGFWDPVNVNIYVSDDKSNWGTAVATGINIWKTEFCCTNEFGQPYSQGEEVILQEVDTTPKNGRYIKVEIPETLDSDNNLVFGRSPSDFAFKIFDAYGSIASTSPFGAP